MPKMSDRYSELCERIRQHCQQQQWYGPDGCKLRYEPGYYDAEGRWHHGEIPASGHYDLTGTWHEQHEHIFDHRGYLDKHGKVRLRAITHDARRGFEYHPATPEQVQATEEAVGIPLLPVLRALYTQVANGGFGPAYGITGIRGGYCFGDDGRYETIDLCTDSEPSTEYIDVAAYVRSLGSPLTFGLPSNVWPAHFLHFCYVGCGEDVCVEGTNGQVYLMGAGDVTSRYSVMLYRLDDSLESWLDRWLRGKKGLWRP